MRICLLALSMTLLPGIALAQPSAPASAPTTALPSPTSAPAPVLRGECAKLHPDTRELLSGYCAGGAAVDLFASIDAVVRRLVAAERALATKEERPCAVCRARITLWDYLADGGMIGTCPARHRNKWAPAPQK